MKRLLWSMSLACFLPTVAGLPAQAKSTGNVAFQPNAQDLTNGFTTNPEVATETSGWSVANVSGPLDSTILPTNKTAKNVAGPLDGTVLPAKTAKNVAAPLDSTVQLTNKTAKNVAGPLDSSVLPTSKTAKNVVGPLDSSVLPTSKTIKNVVGPLDSAVLPTTKTAKNVVGPLDSAVLPTTKTTRTVVSRQPVAAALPLSVETTKVAIAQDPAAPATTEPVQPATPETQPAQPATPQRLADACNCTTTEDTTELNNQLDGLQNQQFPINTPGTGGFTMSPAISINNPVGFGADKGVGFLTGSYQSRTRFTQKSDGELGIGVGLFDAVEAVGLELSYTINSFGTSQGFGSGGFNAKLHKRFGDAGLAVGWNRFANVTFGNTGVASDYPKNSYYAVATQVIRNGDDIDSFLSRIALSAGVGGGQFLSQDTLNNTPAGQNPSGVNAFGSAAFRVAKPLSAIVEWTGQDLAAGLSITPFDGFPLVITPAFRDISGIRNESARFVLGVSTAWQF
jgi:hypothetical protein